MIPFCVSLSVCLCLCKAAQFCWIPPSFDVTKKHADQLVPLETPGFAGEIEIADFRASMLVCYTDHFHTFLFQLTLFYDLTTTIIASSERFQFVCSSINRSS
jgi:hypothetical protein